MNRGLRTDKSQREDDDHGLYKRLTRDVCFLYHELADYGHIMGDLDYASDYPLDYWRLINGIETGRGDDRFIRSGILVLMMAMLQDEFDGSGCWISKHLNSAKDELERFIPEDEDILKLTDYVLHGLQLLASGSPADNHFDTGACWAYDQFVRAYFLDSADPRRRAGSG
jgi:hypothetical protein